MKLLCKGRYSNKPRGLGYEPGLIEVTDEIGAFLLRDAPGSFAVPSAPEPAPVPAEELKELSDPPRTTAYKRPPRSKSLSDTGE